MQKLAENDLSQGALDNETAFAALRKNLRAMKDLTIDLLEMMEEWEEDTQAFRQEVHLIWKNAKRVAVDQARYERRPRRDYRKTYSMDDKVFQVAGESATPVQALAATDLIKYIDKISDVVGLSEKEAVVMNVMARMCYLDDRPKSIMDLMTDAEIKLFLPTASDGPVCLLQHIRDDISKRRHDVVCKIRTFKDDTSDKVLVAFKLLDEAQETADGEHASNEAYGATA